MFKNIVLVFVMLTVPFIAMSNDWNEQVNAILTNIEKQALKYPNKTIISKTKKLTERLLTTHKKSYLKMQIESADSISTSQEVFYSNDEFFVTMYKSEANAQEYNLYYQDGWMYEWNTGEQTGLKYPANTKDLISYVAFSINPLGLVSTFYEDYLEYPDTFETVKNENEPWTELIFTVRRYSYKSLLIELDDVWFHGFKTFDPESLKVSTFRINPPTSYQLLPQTAMNAFKEVTFTEDLTQNLRKYMRYITVVPSNVQ